MTAAILDHLWQSTLTALLIGALTFLFRNNSASVRHGLWFMASIKFLLPFSLLAQIGRMAFTHPVAADSFAALARIEPAAVPFATLTTHAPAAQHLPWTFFAVALWGLGFCAIVLFWLVRAGQLSAIVRSATPLGLEAPVPVKATSELLEPGLVGIFRPVVLVPENLTGQLSQTEINAILAHEICHLRRRDNLTAMIHMLVEAVFWFHPLVWFIGARLVEEREQACDEDVLDSGRKPLDYAQAILKVCRFYFRSPLPCASGVSGADLDRRITAIMARRDADEVEPRKILLLAGLGLLAVMTPLVTGGLTGVQKPAPATRVMQDLTRMLAPAEEASQPLPEAAPPQYLQRRAARPAAVHKLQERTLSAPDIDGSTPIIIIPQLLPDVPPQSSAESSVDPVGTASTDALVCRPPQKFSNSRLVGPRVCLPQREWDQMEAQGLILMPDGRTWVAGYQKQRAMDTRYCPVPAPGASTASSTWALSCLP